MGKCLFYLKGPGTRVDCPLFLTDKIDKDGLVNVDLSACNLSSFDIQRIIQNIDFNKKTTIRDVDFSDVQFPTNIVLNNCLFENISNINTIIARLSLKGAHFKKCEFENVSFIDISSFDDCVFEDCTFNQCMIQSDVSLEKISFKGKIPKSTDLNIDDNKTKPLPKWYLDNLHVEIAIYDDTIFSKSEKKLLKIIDRDGVSLVTCKGDVITKPLLDKIFSVIDNDVIYNSFDGIDFSNYLIPSDVDLYGTSFVGCNLQNATFEEVDEEVNDDFNGSYHSENNGNNGNNYANIDFRYANIAGCQFGKNKPDISALVSSGLISSNISNIKKDIQMSNSNATFSPEQLKSIQNYTAAAPAVANLCRKAVKRLLRFLLTKAGKTKSMITNYVNVAMDLLETFKEEANMLFQLIIGYVCANLHKVGDYMNIDEKSFLKFFSSKKVQAFGEFCVANGKGSFVASLLKRATDIGEAFAGQLFANPEFQRIASVIENPETAARISDSSEDESETEAEEAEIAPAKKTRKHS